MSKRFSALSATLALTGLMAFAVMQPAMVCAQDEAPAHEAPAAAKPVTGSIVSVSATANSLVVSVTTDGKASDVTVTTNDKTKFMVDGKKATIADLVVGAHVTVMQKDGVATKVSVDEPKKKKKAE